MLKLIVLLSVISFVIAQAQDDQQFFQKPKLYLTKANGEDVINSLTDPFDDLDYRLPNTTMPIHYDIFISTGIHQDERNFSGKVDILIEAINDTDEIVIHYRESTITKVGLFDESHDLIQDDVPFSSEDDVEFLIIKPETPLTQGKKYTLEITYLGDLRDNNVGFYRSTYTNAAGNEIQFASTKFEPHNARHAFPCYDEPWIRATYSLQVRHGANYTAISNMPEAKESRTPDPNDLDYVITKFDLLPSVQTYLVAFMISNLAHAEDNSTSVPQRVFAKEQSIDNGEADLALEVAGKILDGFSEYFGVNYTLPKMDQVAFPSFVSGAMENWGMVTYLEPYLLFNKETGTTGNRENVMSVIAHEFTHQWTGNLVSPHWWTYLWLNEGFAAFYESYILEIVFKDERWMDTFLIDTLQNVMVSDAVPSIRPMSYYVESPERVSALFDSIAYSKSASVLRTFEGAFGAEIWRQGMNNYMSARKFNFANPEHLHEEIQKAVDSGIESEKLKINVDQAMKSWETQSGFPYLTVSREGDNLTFEQNRFMYENRNSENLWWIPVSYVTSTSPNFDHTAAELWIPGTRKLTITNSEAPKSFNNAEWIIVNLQQTSYYRVNYDDELWEGIINQINHEPIKIHTLNRAQLIDDSFHFARAELLDYDTLFGILNYLKDETDYIPWASANKAHTFINKRISTGLVKKNFQKFMRENVEKLFTRLGVDYISGEQRVDRYARNIAINIACYHQLEDCLTKTNEKLIKFIENDVVIEPDLINSIYCNGLRKADQKLFDAVVERLFDSSTSNTERTAILSNLDCIQDEALYVDALSLAIDTENNLSTSERNRIVSTAPRNGKSHLPTFELFVLENYGSLNTANLLSNTLDNIADKISDPEAQEIFTEVLSTLKEADILNDEQVILRTASAKINLDWQLKYEAAIGEFFDLIEIETTTTTEEQTTTTEEQTATTEEQTTTTEEQTTTTEEQTTTTASSTTFEPTSTTDGAVINKTSSLLFISLLIVVISTASF